MGEFTIGGVFRQAMEALRRHGVPLLVAAMLLVGAPKLLGSLALWNASTIWRFLPSGLSFLGGIILQVAVIRTVVETSQHHAPAWRDGFRLAVRLFFPVLAIDILFSIGFGLGLMLLVVPGLMLACRWVAVVPVAVVERPGVFEPFRRSAALTDGARWRVFGVLLLLYLAAGLAAFVVFLMSRPFIGAGQIGWLPFAVDSVSSSVLGLFNGVVIAGTYRELRRVKEGFLSDDLVSVFD